MNKVFQVKQLVPYSVRVKNELYSANAKTVMYETESIFFWRLKSGHFYLKK